MPIFEIYVLSLERLLITLRWLGFAGIIFTELDAIYDCYLGEYELTRNAMKLLGARMSGTCALSDHDSAAAAASDDTIHVGSEQENG